MLNSVEHEKSFITSGPGYKIFGFTNSVNTTPGLENMDAYNIFLRLKQQSADDREKNKTLSTPETLGKEKRPSKIFVFPSILIMSSLSLIYFLYWFEMAKYSVERAVKSKIFHIFITKKKFVKSNIIAFPYMFF